jgi:hypothetical protein
MSLRIVLFVSLLFMLSCKGLEDPISQKRIIEGYITALNTGNFEQVSKFLSDSLRTEEGEVLLLDKLEDYRIQFQWDSVFKAHYKLLDIQEIDSGLQVTLSKACSRILYLNDSALLTRNRIEFSEGKISRIQVYDYLNMNFSLWESRRDTLVAWISVNHPELIGFEITQTIQGGQNYLKAIDLYTNRPQP